jgi:uracil DNA glycosylase
MSRPTEIFHDSWTPLIPFLYQEPLLTLNQEVLPNCKYYPERENIFNVFRLPVQHYKVVILGQD